MQGFGLAAAGYGNDVQAGRREGGARPSIRIQTALLTATSSFILAAALLSASSARAACAPAAGNGVAATCTGTTENASGANGYGTGSEQGASVTVEPNATVAGDQYGIILGSGSRVSTGAGSRVEGAEGGIYVDGANAVVDIAGSVASEWFGVTIGSGTVTLAEGATVTVTNTDLEDDEFGAGIMIADDGGVTINGAVSTSGRIVQGVFVERQTPGSTRETNITVGQNGSITTDGDFASAVSLFGGEESAARHSVTINGRITTSGDHAYGIDAREVIDDNAIRADTTIVMNGVLRTSGTAAHGVFSSVSQGSVSPITISNDLRVTGDNAHGVLLGVARGGAGQVTVASGGTVTAEGLGGVGIALSPSGEIQGLGTASILIAEGGRVSATSGPAIGFVDDPYLPADPAVGRIDTHLTIAGTVAAASREDTAVQLGAGDDYLTLLPTYDVTGVVSGGAGFDTFVLDGAAGTVGDIELFFDNTARVTGFEDIRKVGQGTWEINGTVPSSLVLPAGTVEDGTLLLNATAAGLDVTVQSGATLGGTGALRALAIADGGILAPGTSVGTLSMDALVLNNGSLLNFELGAPGVASASDRIDVAGNLTLDGIVNVTDAGGFGNGVYTLINYGTLVADNGLTVGAAPADHSYNVNAGTGTASAVTLEVTTASAGTNQYWDGGNTAPGNAQYGRGGAGVWNAANTNWTNAGGSANSAWNDQFAVFYNGTGDVTVEGEQSVTGLQFAADGYRLVAGAGGSLILRGQGETQTGIGSVMATPTVFVGDGQTATLALPVVADGIYKAGTGTLILTGDIEIDRYLRPDGNGYYGGALQVARGTLTIQDGAGVAAHRVWVSDGARLEVDGPATTLIADTSGSGDYSLDVGADGNGQLAITGGAVVTSRRSDVGAMATDIVGAYGLAPYEGKATVAGAGSAWNASRLHIGHRGGDGELTISDGGAVSGESGYIGYGSLSSPSFGSRSSTGRVTIHGADSAWMLSDEMVIGGLSGSGALTLTDGGVAEISGSAGARIGQGEDSVGRLAISGAGSQMRVLGGGLQAGFDGGTGEIIVTDGGRLRVDGHIDVQVVPGGTQYGPTNGLRIGGDGGAATLIVDKGGTVTAGLMIVGDEKNNGSSIASVVLDGPGSEIVVNENIEMFSDGTFTVSGGAQLRSFADSALAANANREILAADRIGMGISRSTMTVTGADSLWHSDNAIRIHTIGTINVENDAALYAREGILVGMGRVKDLAGPSAILTVDNATLVTDGDLDIANGGAWAKVAFTNGARIETTGVQIGTGSMTSGGTTYGAQADVLVSGAGTKWTDNFVTGWNFFLGNSGQTTLTITDGAVVETGNAVFVGRNEGRADVVVSDGSLFLTPATIRLGESANSTGTLLVTGTGSRMATGNSIDIGVAGRGEVTVADNGLLVASHIHVGRSGGSGLLTIGADGYVNAGGLDILAGDVRLGTDGTLVLGGIGTIGANGTMSGTGVVEGDLVVNAGGTIAPGNSIGTLTVVGDITFNAGSIFAVEVNAAGEADHLHTFGAVTIDGGEVRVLAGMGDYAPATSYIILAAENGLAGTFAGVTSNLAFLDPSLSYDADSVYLTMTRNAVAFRNVGITPNQIAAGSGTESLGEGHAAFDAVLDLSANQARAAFDLLSGEIHASARTAMLEDSRFLRDAVWERLRGVAGAGDGQRALWGQGFGSWGHTGADGNAARLDRSTGGFLMGLDTALGDALRLGAMGGYSRTTLELDTRASSGKLGSYHLGAYAGGQWGAAAIRGGLAHSWHDVRTSRGVAFPGVADDVRAAYDGAALQAFGELGGAFSFDGARFEPFANIAYVRARGEAFSETGGDTALAGAKGASDVTFSTLGLRATTGFDPGGAPVILRAGLGWRHAFGDAVPLARMRYLAGGESFAITGLPVTRNAATVDAGVDIALSARARLGVSYSGQFGEKLSDQAAKASLVFQF